MRKQKDSLGFHFFLSLLAEINAVGAQGGEHYLHLHSWPRQSRSLGCWDPLHLLGHFSQL